MSETSDAILILSNGNTIRVARSLLKDVVAGRSDIVSIIEPSNGISAPPPEPEPASAPEPEPLPVQAEAPKVAPVNPNIPANRSHPLGTTYIYRNGHLQHRGDVLQFEGEKDGKLRYVFVGFLVDGAIQTVQTGDHSVLVDGVRVHKHRGLKPESAKGDLIVLAFPAEAPTRPKPKPATEFPSMQAWNAHRVAHRKAFIDEVTSCNRLIELSTPAVFQVGGSHYIEFLSFKTKAPFSEAVPKGVFDANFTLNNKTVDTKHELIISNRGGYTTLRSGSGSSSEERFCKLCSLLPKTHFIKGYMMDTGLDHGKRDVDNAYRYYVLGAANNYSLAPLPYLAYAQLVQQKKLSSLLEQV